MVDAKAVMFRKRQEQITLTCLCSESHHIKSSTKHKHRLYIYKLSKTTRIYKHV